MAINKLTGTNERMPPLQLTDEEAAAIRYAAREACGDHVNLFGREYWADPDGGVFVVAWEQDDKVSGDPI